MSMIDKHIQAPSVRPTAGASVYNIIIIIIMYTGTIMSRSFGVAKKATAIAVRVLGADGSGSVA